MILSWQITQITEGLQVRRFEFIIHRCCCRVGILICMRLYNKLRYLNCLCRYAMHGVLRKHVCRKLRLAQPGR